MYNLSDYLFSPNFVQLQSVPQSIYSSPDGSCLLVLHDEVLLAYHWSTFGSAEGIPVTLPDCARDSSVLTSFGARGNVHFAILDVSDARIQSIGLRVTHRVTEFAFKEKYNVTAGATDGTVTRHNSLLECHADVWTRFPVIPAFKPQRHVSSGETPASRILVFVADHNNKRFRGHFNGMIAAFQKRTRKPIEDQLDDISVLSMSPEKFFADEATDTSRSAVRAGEWLVELLCLIPIHIALTHDNRFIPLKDGVWSADYERSLAGARVDQIVDSISFGWYESIFRSYMATKARSFNFCF
jgi:hypothetical protein